MYALRKWCDSILALYAHNVDDLSCAVELERSSFPEVLSSIETMMTERAYRFIRAITKELASISDIVVANERRLPKPKKSRSLAAKVRRCEISTIDVRCAGMTVRHDRLQMRSDIRDWPNHNL
jgi:hypothetical protein